MSDADVVREVLAGRYESFGTLVERHFVSVYALCLSYVRNTAEAEDVAPETFMRCYNRLDTLKNPRKFAAWLASVTRNICINHIRADSRRRKLMGDYAENGGEHVPAMDAERRELLRTVRRAVDTLPAKTREAIYLFYFEEKSLKEIGAFLGKSPNAVSGLLKYGRRKLKDTLWEEAEELIKELRPRKEAVAKACAVMPLTPLPMLRSLALPLPLAIGNQPPAQRLMVHFMAILLVQFLRRQRRPETFIALAIPLEHPVFEL